LKLPTNNVDNYKKNARAAAAVDHGDHGCYCPGIVDVVVDVVGQPE